MGYRACTPQKTLVVGLLLLSEQTQKNFETPVVLCLRQCHIRFIMLNRIESVCPALSYRLKQIRQRHHEKTHTHHAKKHKANTIESQHIRQSKRIGVPSPASVATVQDGFRLGNGQGGVCKI